MSLRLDSKTEVGVQTYVAPHAYPTALDAEHTLIESGNMRRLHVRTRSDHSLASTHFI